MEDNSKDNNLSEKKFLSTLNFLTKKYDKKINVNDFITSDKHIYIEDDENKLNLHDCCDLNIYQNIQMEIGNDENQYFFENDIEINDLFKFDYNKIFYYLNHDNIQTIDENAIQIKKKINDMHDNITDQYMNKTDFIFNFNKIDENDLLSICGFVIYYDKHRKYLDGLKGDKKKDYPEKLKEQIKNTIKMLYDEYKYKILEPDPDNNIGKLKKLEDYEKDIKGSFLDKYHKYHQDQKYKTKKDDQFDECPNNIINFSELKLSIYKINKTDIKIKGKDDVIYNNDYIVYNGQGYKFVSDDPKDDNTIYGILNNLCGGGDKDKFNINKIITIQNYDILCFIYKRIKILYELLNKYFDLSNEIYVSIKEIIIGKDITKDIESYENRYPENDNEINIKKYGGLKLFANSIKNLMDQFNEYVTLPQGAPAAAQPQSFNRTGEDKLLTEINNRYKREINPSIKLYNKITNNNIVFNLNDIDLYQDFYFTLFFQDTITKPLDIEYINPLGYKKINTDKTYEVDDEFFYKKKHRVYLMSDFDNLKLFNELKKNLLYLNFKIKAGKHEIVLLNKEGEEVNIDKKDINDIFYFYRDKIDDTLINYKVDERQIVDDKIYIFNEIYDKLIQYHKKFYGGNHKNDEYDNRLNDYIINFLTAYNNVIFNNKKEEYETLREIWKKAETELTAEDINNIIANFDDFNKKDEKDQNMFISSLKEIYNTGHDLLNYYYQTLYKEEKFNIELDDMIEKYRTKCEEKTNEQMTKYGILDKKNEIKTAYESNLNEDEKNIGYNIQFIQVIKTFIYILFDLLINRIFVNQNFTYSDFVNKIADIYFGIFNLLFYKSDEIKINQYKDVLLYYLNYYITDEETEQDNSDKYIKPDDEKFKTLKELNENSGEIIENLINSFIFLLSDDYLNYKNNDNSFEVIKIITNAYIYYYSLYEQNIIIDGQTIIINDSNKDFYYEYQKLISEREKLISDIKESFKSLKLNLNDEKQKSTISIDIQSNIKKYNDNIDEITKKKEELLNPDIIKEKRNKKEKEENIINKKEIQNFRQGIKERYIVPFMKLLEQMIDNEKMVKDEKIKNFLSDKKKYFEDLKVDDINSQIFKNSLIRFNKYKNLRINQHLTNKEVMQYGINEILNDSLIELIKSQQIKKGDYFIVSKNKKVKDAYIYLLNNYTDNGENGFIIEINNIKGFIDILNNLIEGINEENRNICEFIINNQNNVGALKTKLNELTNNGFKNNQLLGKYKLLQKQ